MVRVYRYGYRPSPGTVSKGANLSQPIALNVEIALTMPNMEAQ